MEQANFLEKYRKVQEKFDLPHIQELEKTFKFDIIEEDESVFDQIRLEISDRLFVFTEKIIEPLISEPDSLSTLFEQGMITDDEREIFFKLYSKMQILKWENNLLSIDSNEKDVAIWIRKTWDFWNNELKNELIKICKKMALNWTDMKKEEEKTDYHS
jgi:hypothetical protein